MSQAPGKVFLVGAGPGDLGLVTLRARELIGRAEVLVYDYLAHPDLLAWARPGCLRLYVGKKAGFHALPQAEIEALLVQHARAGRMVVRLKGGDPFVFGRGGEEARALAAAGIPFEIVPGVTAALAAGAYAGIPLTHRNTSAALVFLTGHEDPTKHTLLTDWRAYGSLHHATLAIYMGMGHLREILGQLVSGGLAPETPAAVVQWASLGRQRSVVGTAATLADDVEKAGVGAPAIILVGEVVRAHTAVDWFSHLPLFGRRVVVTRTREQASELREKLEHLGAEVVELPLIQIEHKVDARLREDVFAELGTYDWIVFSSANGVRHFFHEFFEHFKDVRSLGLMRMACVGQTTAKALRDLHLEVEICPDEGTAENLAQALIATGSLDSAKVLVITGNLNRELLVQKLEEARAIVDRFAVYENRKTDLAADPVAEDFRQRGADAVLFASSSAVESFVAQAPALKLAPGAKRPLAGSIGPQTSEAMKTVGMPIDFTAKTPSVEALVAALVVKLEGTPRPIPPSAAAAAATPAPAAAIPAAPRAKQPARAKSAAAASPQSAAPSAAGAATPAKPSRRPASAAAPTPKPKSAAAAKPKPRQPKG